jgi:hypothetical protein
MLLAGGEFGDLRRLYREQAKQVMYSNNILYLTSILSVLTLR